MVRFAGVLSLALCACGRVDFDARGVTGPTDVLPVDVVTTSCTSGQRIAPTAAINTSLSEPADACSLDAALARDGLTAGLDRGSMSCPGTWDPNGSCGCVAVDLGASYALSSVSVWEAPVAQACGSPCQVPDCGTGHNFSIFVANDLASPAWLGSFSSDLTALTETVAPVGLLGRYVMVCRQSWATTRDDVAIDYIDAVCQ